MPSMETLIQTIAQDSLMAAQEQSRFLPVSFTHSFSVKLDNNNFLIWKQQVVFAIKGYGLQRFVFFESAIPPWFLLKEDAQAGNVNKAFVEWEQQDQLLLSWLLSSISEKVLLSCVDFLALVGHILTDKDHIDAILDGLTDEYDAFITSILTRSKSYTQVPILPRLLLIMVLEVVAEAISLPTLVKEEVEVLVKVMEVVSMLETLVEAEILMEAEEMVADLARITTGIILANLNASFVEGLDMTLKGVTTGLIQVLLVQPPILKIVVVLVLILAKPLLIPQLCLQHLRCSMITLGTLILVLQIMSLQMLIMFSTTLNLLVKTKYTLVMVQDQDSHVVLLTGKVKDGLYSFDSSNLCLAYPQAAFNICQSSSVDIVFSGNANLNRRTGQPRGQENTHVMTTRNKNDITKLKVYIAAVKEPKIVELALQKDEWKQAMISEFEALQRNNTWSLVPLPEGRIPIGCRWIYRVKENPDGSVEKYKTRIVFTIALSRGWSVRQLDINNAFLNVILQEEVFMSQPQGFVDEKHLEYVCRLHKALYGLKQAPRAWITSTHTTYILVYVDDILIIGSNAEAKGLPTPMTSGLKISSQDGVSVENAQLYRSTVGVLQYVMVTRPELAYSVNKVCQFMQRATDEHWKAVKRILRSAGMRNATLRFCLCNAFIKASHTQP
ncbi:Retrovirus-related Pol polyprotein from transposon RE2 [Vitis vinifera]|uniref:Retrovirus-related Pol polyprotein from transposon RE2 n=1 Tax=Vitis vinifera TaxID=29760 RepID=A0A438DWB5_VITVI|nr:Retrovirus-related Pol polyprotein from transposon RE2 [Vitis vinifera]